MNKKKFKILFMLSFLPYILLIVCSVYYSIFGYDLYTWVNSVYIKTIYGVDAFLTTLFWNSLTLCFIPILPIVILYQIIYILFLIIKRLKKNRNKEKR